MRNGRMSTRKRRLAQAQFDSAFRYGREPSDLQFYLDSLAGWDDPPLNPDHFLSWFKIVHRDRPLWSRKDQMAVGRILAEFGLPARKFEQEGIEYLRRMERREGTGNVPKRVIAERRRLGGTEKKEVKTIRIGSPMRQETDRDRLTRKIE